MFQFLNTHTSAKAEAGSIPRDINDTSVSSIHNMSKHSFEEVDKNEHPGNTSNFLLPGS
jgi:predicted translin family RNA/ssDNA-binding protein